MAWWRTTDEPARPADEVPGDGEWAAGGGPEPAAGVQAPAPGRPEVGPSTGDDGPNGRFVEGSTTATRFERVLASALEAATAIEGALGAAVVDSSLGMALATAGDPPGIDLDVAAAGNSALVAAKQRTMADLGLTDRIEDVLVTLGTQYHVIRMSDAHPGLFLYLVLDRSRANLAAARFELGRIERRILARP